MLAVLGVLAVCWLVWLVTYGVRHRRVARSFAVAPLGGLLVYGLVVASAPLHARWALSESAFDDQVARLTTPRGGTIPRVSSVPDRLGLYGVYGVDSADRVTAGSSSVQARACSTPAASHTCRTGRPARWKHGSSTRRSSSTLAVTGTPGPPTGSALGGAAAGRQ